MIIAGVGLNMVDTANPANNLVRYDFANKKNL